MAPAIRNVYRNIFFNYVGPLQSYRTQVIRELIQYRGIDPDLFLRLFPVTLFDGFPDSRQCLNAISGIKTRGINGMPVPGTTGKSFIR